MMQKWGLRSVLVSFFWERNGEDSEQSQEFEGKTKKVLKNCLWNAKHAFFATNTSRQSVARTLAKTPQAKRFEKICQVFFTTGSLTREWVASWAAKISVYPSWLDLPLTNKSPKTTRELAAMACNLDDPRLSRQNRTTIFSKFFRFRKNKILSKNT